MEIIAEQMTEMVVQIVAAVVLALVGTCAAWLAKKFNDKMAVLKADTKNEMLVKTIDSIVLAIEQQFTGETGAVKKEKAEELIAEYADRFNIRLSASQVNTLIEAAVAGMNQWYGPLKKLEG